MKAFKTHLLGVTSIVFADNRNKAKIHTILSARDAGYITQSQWPKGLKVKRFPELDNREPRTRQVLFIRLSYKS